MKNIYALQYQILILCLSLFYIFYSLIEYPFIVELYSVEYGYNNITNLTGPFFNFYLILVNSVIFLKSIFLTKIIFALMLFFTKTRKIGFCFLLLHNLIFNDINSEESPELRFLNFLILVLILTSDKKFEFFKNYKKTYWMYSVKLQFFTWIISALAYFVSGYYKYLTPGWIEGHYLYELLIYSHLRRWDVNLWTELGFFHYLAVVLNYIVLIVELIILPMAFNLYTRLFAFILLLILHLGTLAFLDLTQVSLGMLIFQIYLFDPKWLRILKFK